MGANRMRRLEWRRENTFEGWACSECGWVYPNPSLERATKDHDRLMKQKFDEHVCSEHPRIVGRRADKS